MTEKYGFLSDVGNEIALSQNIIDILNDKTLQIELSKKWYEKGPKIFLLITLKKNF